eukprot:10629466-Alexandrium_andersonii.AAC.1
MCIRDSNEDAIGAQWGRNGHERFNIGTRSGPCRGQTGFIGDTTNNLKGSLKDYPGTQRTQRNVNTYSVMAERESTGAQQGLNS